MTFSGDCQMLTSVLFCRRLFLWRLPAPFSGPFVEQSCYPPPILILFLVELGIFRSSKDFPATLPAYGRAVLVFLDFFKTVGVAARFFSASRLCLAPGVGDDSQCLSSPTSSTGAPGRILATPPGQPRLLFQSLSLLLVV